MRNLFLTIGLLLSVASCSVKRPFAYSTELFASAKSESRRYQLDGYKVFIGDLPMDKQIKNAWKLTADMNDLGYPENIVGSAQVTAGNVTAAKAQALHLAKVEIASLIASMIASLIESSVNNNEITVRDAQSLNKYVQSSKELVMVDLGQVRKVLEIYRELPLIGVTVITRVSYNSASALEASRRRIQKEMESETQELHDKLDKVFILERLQPGSNTNVDMEE